MEGYIKNYRSRKVGDKIFVSSESGKYVILDEDNFHKLKDNKIESKNYFLKNNIILNEKNIQDEVESYRKRKEFLFQGTSLHIVVVTLRCNMSCVYCHASSKQCKSKEFDMDKNTAKKTVDFIFKSPSESITIELQGGEPLLNWDVMKYIIEYAEEKNKTAKKNLEVTLVSNFILMDDEKMEYLLKHNVGICTSLDGPKELHNHNRRWMGKDNYNIVTYWIKKINENYSKKSIKKQVSALTTITKESLKYPKEIIDEYVKLGLKTIHFRFLNKLGVASDNYSELGYTAKEFIDFWKKGMYYLEKYRKNGCDTEERIVEIMEKKIREDYDPNYLELRSPCGAVIGQMVYDYNGNIYSCDEARMLGEDIFMLGTVEEEYSEITTCDKACSIVNASLNEQYSSCENCAYKPYCGVCPVCNYSEQGSVIAKIPETDRCKIYKAQFDWVVKNRISKA
ncbi:MAG: His-Xaa-Ser system radical SAM maturase HxsB [Nanobdellota archaeon]